MKKQLLCGLAVLLLVPLSLLLWAFALPAQYQNTFLGELRVKYALLQAEASQPRLILVGGSAVAFGVDGTFLEQQLPGYTVVNFGLYAQLGTRAMLNLSLPQLREGDIVVLMPEQQAEALSPALGCEALWQAADGCWKLLAAAQRQDFTAMAAALPGFAAAKLRYFCTEGPAPTRVYSTEGFNAKGEIRAELCPANTMPAGWDSAMPIVFESSLLTEEFCAMVNEYTAAAAAKGATVWYHFPPMNAAAVDATQAAKQNSFADALRLGLDCSLCGSPQGSTLAAGWFYDTNFHLNGAGKTVFTRQLVRDIKAMLGDTSPTEIDLPELPAMVQAAEVWGDDSDAAYFVYATAQGGLTIVGLTEAGAGRTELTLPTHAEGQPVTALAAAALAGNATLRQVTVQANITALPDGCFAGCTALRRVVLCHTDPAALSAGSGLLEGADFTLCVPAQAVERYRLSYNWSRYASRLQPAE